MVSGWWVVAALWFGYLLGYGWPEVIVRAIKKVRRAKGDAS